MSKNSGSLARDRFRMILHHFLWGKKHVDSMLENGELVLIVEDDDMVRRCLVRLIRTGGYMVKAYSSAEEFLSAEQNVEPMCLLLDVMLPGMSGLELQHRLADESRCLPIIFMSAHDEPGLREQALRNGAISFLFKPFNAEALLCALEPLSSAPGQRTSRDGEVQSFAEKLRSDDPERTSCQPEGGTIQKPTVAGKS